MKILRVLSLVATVISNSARRNVIFLTFFTLVIASVEILSLWALATLITSVTKSDSNYGNQFVDGLLVDEDNRRFFLALLFVAFLFIFKAILAWFHLVLQRRLISDIEVKLQSFIYNFYTNKNFDFLGIADLSVLSHNVTRMSMASNNVASALLIMLSDGLLAASIICAIIFIEPLAATTVLISVIFSLLFFRIFVRGGVEKIAKDRHLLEMARFKFIDATILSLREIKLFGKQSYFQNQFSNISLQVSQLGKTLFIRLGMPVIYLEIAAVFCLLLLMISVRVFKSGFQLLVGVLVLFAGALFRLLPSVVRILAAVNTLKVESPLISVLHGVKTENEDLRSSVLGCGKLKFEDRIDISDLSYSYTNAEKLLISGLNLEIIKGSRICVTGESGVGKSTLIDLILGLRSPTSGKITIDGLDIKSNIESWRNMIGYVPSNVILLDISIRNNVAFGLEDQEIDDARVNRCLDISQLTEDIGHLQDGIHTCVGERGNRLSSGQRQKVGIARALYFNPLILVLDEATAAIDIDSERRIFASLSDRMFSDLTLLNVSHRINTLENFAIYILKDGRCHIAR